MVAEDALAPTAEKALAAAGVDGGVRGWIGLSGAAPAGGWEDVDDWWTVGRRQRPRRRRRRRRPAAADVHLRHRVAAQGRDAVEPVADRPVRQLRDRRRDERGRRRGALAADVPLRAAGLLLLRRRLPRRDQHHPARPRPGRAAGDDRARAGHQAVLPADGVDLAAAPPRLRHHATCRSLRKGYYGASAMPVEVLRELQRRLPDVALWNFYGQTEMAPLATILRPARAARPRPARRAGRRSTSRRGSSTTTTARCRPARSARSCTAARTPRWATTTTRRRPPRRSAGGWFHSGDLGVLSEDGYLSVVDRKKDMIKTGGENVASREVEEAIYRARRASPRWRCSASATRTGSRR